MTALADAIRATSARILILDIERRPMLSYHWAPKVDFIPARMNVERGGMISFAAKWYGEAKVSFYSTHHDGYDEMMAQAWRLIDEADIIVGYNSVGFDMKHLFEEIVKHGMTPPSPHKDIDLIRAARGRFRFPYNSLNEVCRDLGLDLKLANDGFDLWLGCMAGDDKCWRAMKRYNVQDVRVTEQLYDRLRPWIKGHPNLNMYRAERVSACDKCASTELSESGFYYTQTRAYKQFVCRDCGSYSRATHCEGDRTQHRRGVT